MKRLSLATLLLLTASSAAEAALVYALVDYPDLQNGYRLSVTITVSDSAPDDGLLAAEEVLDWEWTSTGPQSFHANASMLHATLRTAHVLIDSNAVSLSVDGLAELFFAATVDPITARGIGVRLGWTGATANSLDGPSFFLNQRRGDLGGPIWIARLPSDRRSPWIVAKPIPECNVLGYFIPSVIVGALELFRRRPI